MASDYRGAISQSNSTQIETNYPQNQNKTKMSYSRVAQQIQFPKKDQAVVTDAIEGLTIKDYTLAIGKIVKPVNILFVSRISNSRIWVYLSTQELVDKLTEPGMKINIDPYTLTLRPLMSKAKRIVISNVCPIIPHYVIQDKIKALDIAPVSQITCIKASINDPEYSHVMSFRRQVYTNPEDFEKLPNSMEIEYEQTTYWIYFSNDKVGCYLCKEEGHLAKDCKAHEINKNPHTVMTSDKESDYNKSAENETNVAGSNKEVIPQTQKMFPPTTPVYAALKRTSSILSGSTLSTTEQMQIIDEIEKIFSFQNNLEISLKKSV